MRVKNISNNPVYGGVNLDRFFIEPGKIADIQDHIWQMIQQSGCKDAVIRLEEEKKKKKGKAVFNKSEHRAFLEVEVI